MKLNNIGLLLVPFLLIFTSCNEKVEPNKFKIKGKLSNMGDKEVIVFNVMNPLLREPLKFPVEVKNGEIDFEGSLDSMDAKIVVLAKQNPSVKPLFLFVNNSVVKIKGDGQSFNDIQIEANEDCKEAFNYLNKLKEPFRQKAQTINNELQKAKYLNNQERFDSLNNDLQQLSKEETAFSYKYVMNSKGGFNEAFVILSEQIFKQDIEQLDSVYNKLKPEVKKSIYGKTILEQINASKLTRVGANAPDFLAVSSNGSAVKLSEYYKSKKYTLIDFWASWCAPCRLSVPDLRSIYTKFNPKGFGLLSVSLDESQPNWKEAIKNDKTSNWVHVIDGGGWSGNIVRQYNIKMIPSNVLIDKDGKIIAKNFNNKSLEKKLNELMQ